MGTLKHSTTISHLYVSNPSTKQHVPTSGIPSKPNLYNSSNVRVHTLQAYAAVFLGGFEYIKKIVLNDSDFKEDGIWVEGGVFDFLVTLLVTKGINLKKLSLTKMYWRSDEQRTSYANDRNNHCSLVIYGKGSTSKAKFLKAVKELSEAEVEIHTSYLPSNLKNPLLQNALLPWDSSFTPKISTRNLKSLLLETEFTTDYLSAELEQLQQAFTNLIHLEYLDIGSIFFHPSFFLIPPESVKSLHLAHSGSITWWRQLALYKPQTLKILSITAPSSMQGKHQPGYSRSVISVYET
ncbi:uncharacterized protein DFL_009410 [Arthrobotrys flagrans]|uniref:Uncharacterized protein n=1 Tax=Arthrobotrys flagrans TaxID=97331 RepID=A0A436ZRI3_ARTFL|nr:hypothetical protein DFL_009410 [Arthrobotrys flagrans]